MRTEKSKIWPWLISSSLVFACFLLKKVTGEGEIAIIPMVFVIIWLMSLRDIRYYPALVLSLSAGRWSGIALLGMSILMVMLNVNRLKKYPRFITYWFFGLCVPLPFLLLLGIENFLSVMSGPATAFEQFSIYSAIFPFFFGLLMSEQFTKQDSLKLFITCVLMSVMALFMIDIGGGDNLGILIDDTKDYIRTEFISFPVCYCLAVYGLINPKYIWCTAIGVFLFVAASMLSDTLTQLGGALIAIVFMVLILLRIKLAIKLINSIIPYLVSIMLVAYVISNIDNAESMSSIRNSEYEDLQNYSTVYDMADRFKFKLFHDRANLWFASWDYIMRAPKWIPNNSYIPQVLISRDNIEFSLPAHNVYLEVLRQLRWGLGSIIIISYFSIFVCGGRLLLRPIQDVVFTIILVSVLSVGIVGSTSGHFTILPNVSFMFASILGISYGMYWRGQFKPANDGRVKECEG